MLWIEGKAPKRNPDPPQSVHQDTLQLDWAGFLVYKDHRAGEGSARALLEDWQRGAVDFDRLLGAFRVCIADEAAGTRAYFCDNAGLLCFFIDQDSLAVSDSFLALVARREEPKPDVEAIAQLLQFSAIYSLRTVCEGIARTSPDTLYSIGPDGLTVRPKGLTPLSGLHAYQDMHALVARLTDAAEGLSVSAIITGGTDSRAVLSHLWALGLGPPLFVTGEADHPDVRAARAIADALALPLTVAPGAVGTDGWVREAFLASDGLTGMLGRWRLYQKNLAAQAAGVQLEFGGVAGELYKNSFINQDYPAYDGPENLDKFYRMKIAAYDYPQALTGPAIAGAIAGMRESVMAALPDAPRDNKFQRYTDIGYFLLQRRVVAFSNLDGRLYACAQPLMERDCAALIYHQDPKALEMQRFQRNQVATYCPEIMNIPTDRGITCNPSPGALARERLLNYVYLARVGLRRVFRRGRVSGRVDVCFAQGLQSPLAVQGIARCREMGLLPPDVAEVDIPVAIADRLATVGLVFSPEAWKDKPPKGVDA